MSEGDRTSYTLSHGAVVRGRRDAKRLALIFTGGDFAEGTGVVLDTLKAKGLKGAFFLTGGYLREPANKEFVDRMVAEGHYVGPHSDAHLLYCPWDDRQITLVNCEEFATDLNKNIDELVRFGVARKDIVWWIPPYEWYNEQIAAWSLDCGLHLFNFTPGTLSHTDYTEDSAKNYRSCDTIMESILEYEKKDPDGLNGFLLLTHVGAGAGRTDKFYNRLGELIDHLAQRGYEIDRIDNLLNTI